MLKFFKRLRRKFWMRKMRRQMREREALYKHCTAVIHERMNECPEFKAALLGNVRVGP